MTQSKISDIRIPLIIPKRNKGHHEVFCNCSISTSTLLDVTDLVKHFTPLIKSTCFPRTPLELAQSILNEHNLDDIDLLMSFSYHLDRASAGYKDSFYEMFCFYNVKGSTDMQNEMGISIPIRVKDIFIIVGKLTMSIMSPKDVYFEDILDHVQKFTDTKIYPSVSSDDKKQLPYLIDVGMNITDYINKLSDSDTIRKIGSTIRLKIEYPELLGSHNISYITTWSSL